MRQKQVIFGILAVAWLLPPIVAANAKEASSEWISTFRSSVRLVAAGQQTIGGKPVLLAGLQIRMDKDWKTYWRNPGDAGLPPSFNWRKSENLKSAKILWPAPKRFADPFGASIGYENEVIFPVVVEPASEGQPVRLHLQFSFAVCKDICAPTNAELSLSLGPSESGHAPLVRDYLRRVPARAAAPGSGPSIVDFSADLDSENPEIIVEAVFPDSPSEGDLFIEGPEDVYIPLTKRVGTTSGNTVRFRVDLTKGDDPKNLKGKLVKLTLVSPAGSRETERQLD